MTERQQRANSDWKAKHNLKRIEVFVPGDLLAQIDEARAELDLSRPKFFLHAAETVLRAAETAVRAVPETSEADGLSDVADRLAGLEGKLDALLEAIVSDEPASVSSEPVSQEPPLRVKGPDGRLVDTVRICRNAGATWATVADQLNGQGLLTLHRKLWTNRSILKYCARHGIAADEMEV